MTEHRRPAFTEIGLPFIIFTAIWGSTWIVIRDQLGTVPAQWSVAYRFIISAAAMALVTRWKKQPLRPDRGTLLAAAGIGFLQFFVNFNAVYLAERYITSGLVATFFALLVVPATLLAWAFLGQRPNRRFLWSSAVAVVGVAILFSHELREHAHRTREIVAGLALTLVGMLGAAGANTLQARPKVKAFPLFTLLTWSMLIGAVMDIAVAFAFAGPPTIDTRPGYWAGLLYLAIAASVLTFSLYYPVVRKIGPAKAAYSSVIIPVIAMAFSTVLEDYRWTPLAAAGAVLALGGMVGALTRERNVVAPPDAA